MHDDLTPDQPADTPGPDARPPIPPRPVPKRFDMARMDEPTFNAAAERTRMDDRLKRAAAHVLIRGESVATWAARINEPPSVVSRACRRICELVEDDPRDAAFAAWLAERVEPAEPIPGPSGRMIRLWISAKELQEDLNARCPDLVWGPKRFGQYMRAHGHASGFVGGTTVYQGLKIKRGPDEPAGDFDARLAVIRSKLASKERKSAIVRQLREMAPDRPSPVVEGLRVGWLSRQPD